MNNKYLNIYNNLVKLTRNKKLFKNLTNQDTFSDRLMILFIHFSFFLRSFKNEVSKKELQVVHDYLFKQIELSIREIGYGDTSINKKMKNYINMFYFVLKRIDKWNDLSIQKKRVLLSNLLNIETKDEFLVEYFEKYTIYLKNNTFNYFTKDVIKLNF